MAHPAALKWGRYFSLIRVGLGSVPVSVVSSREGENILSDAHLMSICHVPFSVYHFWASQVQCEFLPCWATEWALGSVNSTRWKGLGPGILYSLSRYSFNNPRKFFPPYCPSKISQCCLERNRKGEKTVSIPFLRPSRTSLGFGGCDWCGMGNRSFQESPVWRKNNICQAEVTFCKMGLLAPSLLNFDGFCAFWCAWRQDLRPVVFCFMFEHQWWRVGDWLSAIQSTECLLPLELIPLELLHSWLSYVAPYGNH